MFFRSSKSALSNVFQISDECLPTLNTRMTNTFLTPTIRLCVCVLLIYEVVAKVDNVIVRALRCKTHTNLQTVYAL